MFANRTRLLIITLAFITITAFAALQNIFPLYGVQILFIDKTAVFSPMLLVSLMLTFIGLVIAVTQIWLIKPLARRFGERNLVSGGNVAMALGAAAVLFLSAFLLSLLLATNRPYLHR